MTQHLTDPSPEPTLSTSLPRYAFPLVACGGCGYRLRVGRYWTVFRCKGCQRVMVSPLPVERLED